MKNRYRLFLRRKSVYYAFDNTTKTFESLKTKDKAEAARLLLALNEAGKQPAMNLGLARVYLKHSDPHGEPAHLAARPRRNHQAQIRPDAVTAGLPPPRTRRSISSASALLIETQAEHFLEVMKKGTRVHQRLFAQDRTTSPWT